MTEWTTYRIEDLASDAPNALATGPFGSAISSRYFVASGVPVIRGSNLSTDVGVRLDDNGLAYLDRYKAAEFKRSIARRGDLVFTCWGTVGQVGLIGQSATFDEYVVSNKQMKMTPNVEKADSLFLYYLMSSPAMVAAVQRDSIGAAVPGFNLGQLREIQVKVPGVSEQRGIAATLGALDDKIESNRRVVALLEDRLAVEFKRVKATASVTRRPLGEMVETAKGVSYKSAGLMPSRTSLVTLKSFDRKGGYKRDGLKPYVGDYKPQQVVRPGEIVVAQTDLTQGAEVVGRAVRVPADQSADTLVASLDLIIVRPREVTEQYLLGLLTDEDFREHCRSRTSGTTVLHLAKDAIPTYQAPIAPSELQVEYSQLARPLLDLVDVRNRESVRLAALRDALLPELLSGRIRVPEAGEAVAEVGA